MNRINYKILCLLLVAFYSSCNSNTPSNSIKINYPKTLKTDSSSTLFGVEIKDPYRWLEDDISIATKDWVKQQNDLTFNYLKKIPYRQKIKERLKNLIDYKRITAPFKEGDYTYYYKNNGLQNHSVLYRKSELSDKEEIFIDPNTFSKDGTVSLGTISFSKNGGYAAYSISEGGSDWGKIIIINAITKKIIEDTLVNIKFSGISWYKNNGFYYSSYDKPKGSELSSKTDQHKLFYHKLNSKQTSDQVIYGAKPKEKHRYVGGYITENNRYLIITAANTTSGNKLMVQDLEDPNKEIKSIYDNFEYDSYVLFAKEKDLYISTNEQAPNSKLIKITLPNVRDKKDIIPETNHALSVNSGNEYFFAEYLVDALSKIEQYDLNGNKVRTINLPDIGTAKGFSGKSKDKTLYYTFSNNITPSSIYKYDSKEGISKIYKKSECTFNSDNYESHQVFYKSKDGTKIPMTINYKKGISLNGKNPTILYGYGGFNISLQPRFSSSVASWMEMGGIYAIANIRGGGEYGKKWHDEGIKMKKQNVFDDFIAAAEYLIKKKYTSTNYLAIKGGSNGGLLVGAVMTQRPDLIKVAIPIVGVLDMLRYHKFTAGAGWSYDYGTANDSKEMFEYLKGYSPLHNMKANTNYPATLIVTSDHDDRVVPAHSFKFAATLQELNQSNNPTLIRIETNAGHGSGTSISKHIDQTADIYSFILFNMELKTIP